jgi:hypothetical protein
VYPPPKVLHVAVAWANSVQFSQHMRLLMSTWLLCNICMAHSMSWPRLYCCVDIEALTRVRSLSRASQAHQTKRRPDATLGCVLDSSGQVVAPA